MRILLLVASLLSLAFLGACKSSDAPPRGVIKAQPQDVDPPQLGGDASNPEDIVSGVGTIRYIDLEGGFYAIESDQGDRYNPTNLQPEFEEDGLRIRFRGVLRKDVVTTQMWGQSLEIQEIMRL